MEPRNASIGIRGLRMSGCVLHIGAHPDDEDIGLIAYVARKHGGRAIYWSATRGEGGQNRIGPYSGLALGVYRTWESMAAREGDGGECLFGPFFDFGFSKTGEEALGRWGGLERMICEIVRVIRLTQPDVIVARWQGNTGDFHGQHQAVGMGTEEAFHAAADPARFPELGLPAWQTLKVYESLDNSGGDQSAGGAGNLFGRANPAYEEDGFLRLNTGEFDPATGLSYQQQAWIAYNRHQTQAIGLAPDAGDFFYYFRRHSSVVTTPARESDFYEGFDSTLTGLARLAAKSARDDLAARLNGVVESVAAAEAAFHPATPGAAASPLLDALERLRTLRAKLASFEFDGDGRAALDRYLTRKEKDIQRMAAECLGLKAECTVPKAKLIPGETVRASARLWNHGGGTVDNTAFELALPAGWQVQPTGDAEGMSQAFDITASPAADVSCPYWLARPRNGNLYAWDDPEAVTLPFAAPPVRLICATNVMGRRLILDVPVVLRQPFPGGYRELPISVQPPITLQPKARKEFLQVSGREQTIEVQVLTRCAAEEGVHGTLALEVPDGWRVAPDGADLDFARAGDLETATFSVTVPAGCGAGQYTLGYHIRCGGRRYAMVLDPVRMGPVGVPRLPDESNCIREEMVVSKADVAVNIIDAKLFPDLTYAYVKGAEENLVEALGHFDLMFHDLRDDELGHGDLSRFDLIVIGPNAYLVREELRKNARRLLDYVEAGGTLVVQFQGYGYARSGLAPYPFAYSNPHDRVTWEAAPVTMLDPDNELFTVPNHIGAADFDDWVHDRGMYFFGERDKRYVPLLSCSDPDEPPRDGGMMVTSHGRGTYIYTGYSFFRQLPAGVTGAFRLIANILAIPMSKRLRRAATLRRIEMFSSLSEEQILEVARVAVERWDDDGAYLCREGDVGNELMIVLSGEVEIIKESAGDRVIYIAREGDAIGELAILAGIPRTAAMRARGDLHCLVIRSEYFHALMRTNFDLAEQMLRSLALKLAVAS